MGDNLDHLGVRIAGALDRGDVRLADLAALASKLDGEAYRRIRLDVVRGAVAIGGDLRVIELRQLAGKFGVRGEAIVATVRSATANAIRSRVGAATAPLPSALVKPR